jgi:hypothetical protein
MRITERLIKKNRVSSQMYAMQHGLSWHIMCFTEAMTIWQFRPVATKYLGHACHHNQHICQVIRLFGPDRETGNED